MSDDLFWARLRAPFPAADIEWRVGSTTSDKSKGLALAYITARAVMDRLDEVAGQDGWTDSYRPVDRATATSKGWICRLEVRVGDEWTAHEDGADETAIEPTKGGISDALKRAAVHFGIGRYLYHLEAQWVPIEPQGRGFALKGTPRLPAWALPGGSGRPGEARAGPVEAAPVEDPAENPPRGEPQEAPLPRPETVEREARSPHEERMVKAWRAPSVEKDWWKELMPRRGPLRSVWERSSPDGPPPWYWAIEGSRGGGRHAKLEWAAGKLEDYALDRAHEEGHRETAYGLAARARYCCSIYELDEPGPLDDPKYDPPQEQEQEQELEAEL